MKLYEGMFAIKLYELEQEYGRMQSRLRLCQREDHPKIQQELQKATDEYKKTSSFFIIMQKAAVPRQLQRWLKLNWNISEQSEKF